MLTWETPEACVQFWQHLINTITPVFEHLKRERRREFSYSAVYDTVTEVRLRGITRRRYRLEIYTRFWPAKPFGHILGVRRVNPQTTEYFLQSLFGSECECENLCCDFVQASNHESYISLSRAFPGVLQRYNHSLLLWAAVGPGGTMSRFRNHPLCDFQNLWRIIDAYVSHTTK